MINNQLRFHMVRVAIILVCLAFLSIAVGCSSDKTKAKAIVAEYLTGQGTTDITIDIFHRSKNSPDKAYTSATVTYNFATSSGKAQREFLGFVLAQSGDTWRIERTAGYTKDADKAEVFIAGGK